MFNYFFIFTVVSVNPYIEPTSICFHYYLNFIWFSGLLILSYLLLLDSCCIVYKYCMYAFNFF